MTQMHSRLPIALFASACAVVAMPADHAHATDIGVSVNAGNPTSADVGASLGRENGVDATADASTGGSNGVDANASASARGSGIDANVNAIVGGSDLAPGANARLGGDRGVNADINARTAGSREVDDKATASIGGSSGAGTKLALGDANDRGGMTAARNGTLSASQARTIAAFRERPVDEQRKMLVRCADISAAGSGDAGLAGLCSLLQASVSH
ncbi:hypothetical protein NXC14_CH02078 [Rhizobium sp. NXC14]|uniref:hypothetical protein n=1 Tax=Rhizobium sp. NXC14 TaxID=1981173 RepID=UPI000A20303F|nr:hypothetical protein [Rhizobium sp. NXC14]ARO30018.1 hypothetical protein NXC14_CH02078 [Rhizobium sp. NXC14]